MLARVEGVRLGTEICLLAMTRSHHGREWSTVEVSVAQHHHKHARKQSDESKDPLLGFLKAWGLHKYISWQYTHFFVLCVHDGCQ